MKRDMRIDLLKAIAIIAVVVYHFGWMPYGYLGVDIFLVISGYFMMKTIQKNVNENKLSFWKYMIQRILRLLPLILVTVGITYLLGYFLFLPESYKVLSENGVASCLFANNLFEGLMSHNYWNLANSYKPLMHTWYVGVLMQAYAILMLIYVIVNKCSKNKMRNIKITVLIISVVSLTLYCIPSISPSSKFYYVPFRLFELTLGSYVATCTLKNKKLKQNFLNTIHIVCWILLLFTFVPMEVMNSRIRLLLTVVSTLGLLFYINQTKSKKNALLNVFSLIGKASFSIYLCHQVIIAFVFSSYSDARNLKNFFIIMTMTAIISTLMYHLIEKPVAKISKKMPKTSLVLNCACCLALVGTGIKIYFDSGIVRNIPELGIVKSDYNWPKTSYNNDWSDIVYGYVNNPRTWTDDFKNDEKVKVFVVGNSYARDWANVLNESDYADQIQIKYFETSDNYELDIEHMKPSIKQADIVFVATEVGFSKGLDKGIPDCFINNIPKEKLYVVGDKQLGTTNNLIYSHRNDHDYFNQTIKMDVELLNKNKRYANAFEDHFIDIMDYLTVDNKINIFTSDKKYISWDCRHLTVFGARYLSQIIDLSWMMEL